MSGLVGWADFACTLDGRVDVVDAMTDALRHRGPHGRGTWVSGNVALGHRRLATRPEQGEQPALLEVGDATVALTYDGDIDNLAALRRRVAARCGRLPTTTDTDVLLAAYLVWGRDFVESLDGSFAFAVWDGRSRRLLLGRDRLGVKPLYYFAYRGGVVVASEPKGIMANPRFTAQLDLSALPILLQPRLTLPGETPLDGLREVPPAHVVTCSERSLRPHRYWELTSAAHEESFEETAAHVRSLLDDAVRRRVPAAGPCGAMLSGGVDSTAVAAIAIRAFDEESAGRHLDTFCVGFDTDPANFVPSELRPEVDSHYAATAAAFIGSDHTTVTVAVPDLEGAIPATRTARDLPGWGQFDASMYLLFGQMRQRGCVALSGEAADEFFGGYPYLFRPELVHRDTFPWLGDGPRLADFLAPDVAALGDPREDERARYNRLLSEVPRLPGEDAEDARMREVLFLGMSGPLAVVLDRKERMSMAHGLEVRLPFCDHRLVEYVWNIPWSTKCTGGLKGLLKAATADLLPPSTIARPKSAYPHVQSPEYDRALVREAAGSIDRPGSPLRGLFDVPRLTVLLEQIDARELRSSLPGGVSGAQLLVQLVETSRWIEDYQVSMP